MRKVQNPHRPPKFKKNPTLCRIFYVLNFKLILFIVKMKLRLQRYIKLSNCFKLRYK